jgi:hypothetical protein
MHDEESAGGYVPQRVSRVEKAMTEALGPNQAAKLAAEREAAQAKEAALNPVGRWVQAENVFTFKSDPVGPAEVTFVTEGQHDFEPSYTGMVCGAMVTRDGGGDQCGEPRNHPVHKGFRDVIVLDPDRSAGDVPAWPQVTFRGDFLYRDGDGRIMTEAEYLGRTVQPQDSALDGNTRARALSELAHRIDNQSDLYRLARDILVYIFETPAQADPFVRPEATDLVSFSIYLAHALRRTGAAKGRHAR